MHPARCVPQLLAILLTLISVSPASALQSEFPSREVPGDRGERVAQAAAQTRLNAQPEWQEFLANYGPSWKALWDEATKRPVRFWGAGIETPSALSGDDHILWAWSEAFLANQSGLLGDGVSLPDLQRQVVDRRGGITTVSFVQTYQELPVFGSRVSLRFKAGRFVVGQIETIPGIRLSTTPQITPKSAQASALTALKWTEERSGFKSDPSLLIFPVLGEETLHHHLAWKVDVAAVGFPSNRSVFIDASSGKFLGWHEHNRFISGVVLAEIDDRYPEAGRTQVPMANVDIASLESEATTDTLGEFMLEQKGPIDVIWSVGSEHWRIVNQHNDGAAEFTGQLGSDGELLVAAPAADLGNGATRRTLAQLDIHTAGHVVRSRALQINPGFPWALEQAQANVNIATSGEMPGCNAWFDEASHVNFLRQGAGCNNTGRIADVMYHEYGHGFHGWSIIPGAGAFDYALSEGLSDYLCVTITGDPAMARNFVLGSGQPLRNVGPNRVWPEDIEEDPHQTGLIIAGALWDLRSTLIEDQGEDDGVALADHIFWQVASRASSVDTSYVEALLADDDNGDLSDGTPNQCAIDEAFNLHGLGPGTPGDTLTHFFLEHEEASKLVSAWDDVVLTVDAGLANPDCAEGNLSHVTLHYSQDPTAPMEDWPSQTLSGTSAGRFEAVIPGSDGGHLLRYRFEAVDEDGEVVAVLPRGSRTDPYFASWVGPYDVLWQSDFEDDDGGFTHALIDGPDNEGADDWGWGPPGGRSGDPSVAASGTHIWGNDITPEDNWNGAYQPDVHNVLRSGSIAVGSARNVHLQFRRWLTVEDGYFDEAWIAVNGTTVWTQYDSPSQDDANEHHEDYQWAFRSYDISNLIEADGLVEIEWHLESDGGLELGGWNIDDVVLITPVDAGDADSDPSLSGSGQGCACSALSKVNQSPSTDFALLLLGMLGLARRRSRGTA
jgi:hypothetical protein